MKPDQTKPNRTEPNQTKPNQTSHHPTETPLDAQTLPLVSVFMQVGPSAIMRRSRGMSHPPAAACESWGMTSRPMSTDRRWCSEPAQGGCLQCATHPSIDRIQSGFRRFELLLSGGGGGGSGGWHGFSKPGGTNRCLIVCGGIGDDGFATAAMRNACR